jgi:hypothetical protein
VVVVPTNEAVGLIDSVHFTPSGEMLYSVQYIILSAFERKISASQVDSQSIPQQMILIPNSGSDI